MIIVINLVYTIDLKEIQMGKNLSFNMEVIISCIEHQHIQLLSFLIDLQAKQYNHDR